MSILTLDNAGARCLLMGNEAIARGALEAGVAVAAGYPGTPSSEIIENLARAARDRKLYVEWSVNEKVALEVAAAASFAGLRALAVMKQNGVNVASDFLLHLAISGVRGGLVLVPCDDPGALSSANEGESRHFARLMEIPLLEPGDFQEAKDMVRFAFELSEEIESVVMLRSVTRLSHASGSVVLGGLPDAPAAAARFAHTASAPGGRGGPVITLPVAARHRGQQLRLARAVARFEQSPFNTYAGPERPELLVITSSACHLYSREAVHMLGLGGRVGILKLGTTWPLPPRLLERHLRAAGRVLVVEEVIPFLEENVKVLAAELAAEIGARTFFGKRDGTLPAVGELGPDLVAGALARILGLAGPPAEADTYAGLAREAAGQGAPSRELAFCAGCPHRASFWSIHRALALDGRKGFVCGDIGCYSLGMLPTGFGVLKTLHAMGSGAGLACGFGKLAPFGMDQPVLAVCGDSTFFHAVLPALVNAAHHRADFTLVVLDNSGTAMTGFQPHPGLPADASGDPAPAVSIEGVCRSLGAAVRRADPFDLEETQRTLLGLIDEKGLNVLILKQSCALSPEKKARRPFEMSVAGEACVGQDCGCNRLCTRIFKCPGLIWDAERGVARIDEVICTGCGVCAGVCPADAIQRRETA
jgi:indolepyruvate ferredoxin oxidoreductase alpha subunit